MGTGNPPPRRPARAVFIFLAVCGLLLAPALRVPLGFLPETGEKSLSIHIDYPGAFESEIERVVTIPLENALSDIPGIRGMYTVSERDGARIHLVFSDETDSTEAYLDARERVYALYGGFPDSIRRPLITRSDPRDRPVFTAAFDAEGGPSPDELKRTFEGTVGAGEVETGGGEQREIRLHPDPDRLAAAGADFFAIPAALRNWSFAENFGPPGGPLLSFDCRAGSLDAIRNIPLGPALRIADIAEVSFAPAEKRSVARLDGEERLLLSVRRAGDANVLSLCARLRRLAESIPGAVILHDEGGRIRIALRELFLSLCAGVGFVALFTLVFLRRPALAALTALAVPFSGLASLAALAAAGLELDIMTMSGLAVGAGIVIDGGILLGDEFVRGGFDPEKALRNSRSAILYSSLTTAAVFFPLFFAPPLLARRFAGLAIVVTAQIGASLLYVFAFMPPFLAGVFRRHAEPQDRSRPDPGAGVRSAVRLMSRRKFSLAAALLLLLCGGAAGLRRSLLLERQEPAAEGLSFGVEFESGVPLARAEAAGRPLERKLRAMDGVGRVWAKYEGEKASFDLTLNDSGSREKVREEIVRLADSIPDGFLYFPDDLNPARSVEVVLTGPDSEALREAAVGLAGRIHLLPGTKGIVFHFKPALPSKVLRMDPAAAGGLGVSPAEAAETLRWALSGPVADKIFLAGGETDIRVLAGPGRLKNSEDLLAYPVPTGGGKTVEAGGFSRLEEESEVGRIYRVNRGRSAAFSVLSAERGHPDPRKAAAELAAGYPFPPGFTAAVAEEELRERAAALDAAAALLLAFPLVGMILVFHYENLWAPVFILAQIPFCLAAALIPLGLLGLPFSVSAALGVVMTGGIVVNNSLLVFPRGGSFRLGIEAAPDALAEKSRPILTAGLTTLGGILPLLFSGGSAGPAVLPLVVVITAGTAASPFVLAAAAALAGTGVSRGHSGPPD